MRWQLAQTQSFFPISRVISAHDRPFAIILGVDD